jgi:hypothetical protein
LKDIVPAVDKELSNDELYEDIRVIKKANCADLLSRLVKCISPTEEEVIKNKVKIFEMIKNMPVFQTVNSMALICISNEKYDNKDQTMLQDWRRNESHNNNIR